jgi:integrase
MASIQKRGKRYRVRWHDLDDSERSYPCPDRSTAQLIKLEIEQAFALGQQWLPPEARARAASKQQSDLRDILKAYIKESVRVNKKSTAEGHARALDIFLRFLSERMGKETLYPPSLLSRRLLGDLYDWTAEGQFGRPRKVATRRRLVNAIELVWAWAYEDDEFGETMPRPRRLRMPKEPGSITVAPTWAEMDAAISAASAWQRQLLIVLRFTGLRVQQAMQLLWNDVDLERATLRVRPELGKSQQEQSGRVIPISQHLVSVLASWGRREGPIIPSSRKIGPRHREARARDAQRAWIRAGVREEAFRQPHHAFRKGLISGLKRAGADADAVEYLVGHSLGLRGVYTDPDALPLREAVALIPPLSIEGSIVSMDDMRERRKTLTKS